MDDALVALARRSSRHTAARCCSTPATTSWRPSAPTRRAKTMPSAPCAAAWRCSPSARRSAPKCRRAPRPRRLRRARRHPHRRRAARGGVDAEGTIRGIAVNIAARMEQTAPAGALRISHDTYAPGARPVRRRGAGAARWSRASTSPSQSYLVAARQAARVSRRHPRHRRRGDADDRPRRRARSLQDAFERLFTDRKLAAVTVVADAGIGKSRLLYEFDSLGEARPETLRPLPAAAPRRRRNGQPYRPAARHHRLAVADRRRRQHRRRASEDGTGHRAAVPGRRRTRPGRRPCPPARPPDRHRLAATVATSAASATTPSRSATARSMPRRSCSGASVPATAPRRLAARRPALGRRREPGLPRTTWPRSTATCRC